MFGSTALEVALGMAFIYLVLSLLCSYVHESIATLLHKRAFMLRDGVKNLLNDPSFTGLAQKIYCHGLVDGLAESTEIPAYIPAPLFATALADVLGRREETGNSTAANTKFARGTIGSLFWRFGLMVAATLRDILIMASRILSGNGPKPLPADTGSVVYSSGTPNGGAAQSVAPDARLATIESSRSATRQAGTFQMEPQPATGARTAAKTDDVPQKGQMGLDQAVSFVPVTIEEIKVGISLLPNGHTRQALAALVAEANGDMDKLKKGIESWYDSSMDRVIGWYTRWTKRILVVLATILVVGGNIDTVKIAHCLATDSTTRSNLATAATNAAKLDAGQLNTLLTNENLQAGIPVGWGNKDTVELVYQSALNNGNYFWNKLAGLMISICMLSLGAPFWFDVLKKVANVRGVGKNPDEPNSSGKQKAES